MLGVGAGLVIAVAGCASVGAAATALPVVETAHDEVNGRHVTPETGAGLESDVAIYRKHIELIADPAMEGRAPGTNGNRVAANYIENTFRRLGLKPAFPGNGEGESATAFSSYRQVFEARPSERPGDSIRLKSQEASYTTTDGVVHALKAGVDFNVLGHSASGDVTGPLVFVGYGLESDTQKYRSIPEGTSLRGKIAVLYRLEPMDENGHSLWAKEGWSFLSGLLLKFNTVSAAGASGIILVNPPGAVFEDLGTLGGLEMTAPHHQPVPVVMLSIQAGERLLHDADGQGRTAMDLRVLADKLGEGQDGVIDLPNATVTLKADIERTPLMTDNVGAVLPGVGALADEYVVVGGHYDHLGYGYFSSRGGPEARGKIHPGADDNASGASGVLLAAEKLAHAYAALPPDMPRRSVLFMAFSAEESGLEGSKFYVKHPIAAQEKHDLMVNMDMIGRLRENRLNLQGTSTAVGFAEWLAPQLSGSGIEVVATPGGSGPSDHASFYAWGVPVLFAFTGLHDQYHTPQDVLDTINVEGATRVVDLMSRVVLDAAERSEKLAYVGMGKQGGDEQAGPSRGGTKVRFGIAPGDYSGSEEGVLVGDVYPGTPAAKAGLQKDDLMTRWNGKELKDVQSWMPYLADAKPGDQVLITFRRKVGDHFVEMSAAVELVARQTGGK